MKIYRSSLAAGKPLILDNDIDFSKRDLSSSYPHLAIKQAHIEGIIEKEGEDFLTANCLVEARVSLADARSGKPFETTIRVDDVFDLLEGAEQEGEGYIFPGNGIELDDFVFALIQSNVPLAPHGPDSTLPQDGEGYSVYQEGSDAEASSAHNPFADIPDDYLEQK